MELNKKIAERRAELQRVQAAEEERKKQEEREQAKLRQAEEIAIQELAAKEASLRIQAIEAQLEEQKEQKEQKADVKKIQTPKIEMATHFNEKQKRVREQADKSVDEKIKELAYKQLTKGENFIFCILFFVGISGFFMAWWMGLGLCVFALYYLSTVTGRHEAAIKAILGKG